MRKTLSLLLAILTLVSITGCIPVEGTGNNQKEENKYLIHKIFNAFSREESEKYEIVDSFRTDDGRYYYLYDVGFIDAAPISIDNSAGVYYSGGNTELSFTMTKTTEESITKTITSIASNTISETNSTTVSGEFGVGYKDVINAKVGAAITNECTSSLTQTFEDSVSKTKTETVEFSQTITHSFKSDEDQIGFYCYTSLASVQLYELIVYNSTTKEVESAIPYTIVGKAFPGLIYSQTSFFNCATNKIEFDLDKIRKFPRPDALLSDKVKVSFNSSGTSEVIGDREYRIGDTYGELPVLDNIHGYKFNGWRLNGEKVTSDTIITESHTLIADWSLLTNATYTCSRMDSQNAFATSKDMDTCTVEISLHQKFDISELKKQGYAMRLTITYDADRLVAIRLGKVEYDYWFVSSGRTIYSVSDELGTKATSRTWQSGNIIDYDGTIFMKLYTPDDKGIKLTNIKITVEFVK